MDEADGGLRGYHEERKPVGMRDIENLGGGHAVQP
jgi:hypothetical protein